MSIIINNNNNNCNSLKNLQDFILNDNDKTKINKIKQKKKKNYYHWLNNNIRNINKNNRVPNSGDT